MTPSAASRAFSILALLTLLVAVVSPVQIRHVQAASTVAAAGYVAAWGSGAAGPLGTTACCADRSSPTAVPRAGQSIAMASSGVYTVVAHTDGTVWGWGSNRFGTLGPGPRILNLNPKRVPGISDVVALAACSTVVVALTSDGSVWTWGGVIGLGRQTTSEAEAVTPTRISGLRHVVRIAATETNALAITDDGTLYSWGDNDHGQIGDGTWTDRIIPVRVVGLIHVVSAATSGSNAVAAESDGSVWAWGSDVPGLPMHPGIIQSAVPERVAGLPPATAVAAGPDFGLSLVQDGTVWAWGQNSGDVLHTGKPSSGDSSTPPGRVIGLHDVISIVGGSWRNMAIEQDGTVWSWGFESSTVTREPGLAGAVAIAVSAYPRQALALVSVPPPSPAKVQPRACVRTALDGSLVGSRLTSLLVDPRSGHVFVLNTGFYQTGNPFMCTGSVTTLDGRTGRVLKTVLLGRGSPSLALSPMSSPFGARMVLDGGHLLVAYNPVESSQDTAGGISVIDPSTGGILRSISVGYDVQGVAADGRFNHVYVPFISATDVAGVRIMSSTGVQSGDVPVPPITASIVDHRAHRIILIHDVGVVTLDTRTSQVIRRARFDGGSALDAALDERTGHLFLSYSLQPHCCGPSLQLIDSHTGARIRTLGSGGPDFYGTVIMDTPAARVLVRQNTVTTVRDPRSAQVLRRLPVLLGPSVVDSRNGWIYSITAPRTVSALDPRGWRVARTFHPGGPLTSMALDERTNRIFVTAAGEQGVADTATVRSFCMIARCP